jgi:hypothetical protein
MNFRARPVALRMSLRAALWVCVAALAFVPVQGWGQGAAVEAAVNAAAGLEGVLESLAVQAAKATREDRRTSAFGEVDAGRPSEGDAHAPRTVSEFPDGYGFSWEVVQDHFECELAGHVTVRLYLNMVNATDFLSSVGGDVAHPLFLTSTASPSWWNKAGGGKVLADACPLAAPAWCQGGIDPDSVVATPLLGFDSWITLGKESTAGPWCTGLTAGYYDDFATLGSEPGTDLAVFDLVGAAWYTPFPGPSFADMHPAFAGDSLRVLVGQFTTTGQLSGQAYVQVFANADYAQECLGLLPIPPSPLPCAENVDGDDLCDTVDPCVGTVDACGVCNGPGAIYACGCTDLPEGACDCEGTLPDATGNCAGDCPADLDGDGVCDLVDDCVGALDACGVCNGPGAIYECGCSDVPDCACDCDGNALDALGVCGGSCAADADGDGVCDDADDCVGWVDACGECNGLGPIYSCGCSDVPVGDCDCQGHQLDALGVCGGTCLADADGDGEAGCTYPQAVNFSAEATHDDGSCVFEEVEPCIENTGVYDVDLDGLVSVTDFVQFLSVFGLNDYDGDGVWNDEDLCTNLEACNYQAVPTEPCAFLDAAGVCGGSCAGDADGDGVCDDVDPCDGVEDVCGVCGVCGGAGPLSVTLESVTPMLDSVYAAAIDTWYVFEVGADTVWSYECPPPPPPCDQPVGY